MPSLDAQIVCASDHLTEMAADHTRDAPWLRSRVHSIDRGEHPLLIQLDAQWLADHSLGLAPHVFGPCPERPRRATVLLAHWLARPGRSQQRLFFGRQQLLDVAVAVGPPPAQPPQQFVREITPVADAPIADQTEPRALWLALNSWSPIAP